MLGVPDKLFDIATLDLVEADATPLTEQFAAVGYTILATRTDREVRMLFEGNGVDAIVCGDRDDTVALLRALVANKKPIGYRPLVCVLTSDTGKLPHLDFADMVMPVVPFPFLERNLRDRLIIRQQRLQFRQERDVITLLKNAIVRNVSHELKTPLLQVKSAVALIEEEQADNRVSQMAVEATARLEAVVKNITLLTDSMNGKVGPVLIRESVEQAIRNLRRTWLHKNAIDRLQVAIEPDLPPVLAAGQGLAIALQQLIDNALKFSKGPVTVRVRLEGDMVRVEVIDEGIGIDPDQVQQIFVSFFQVDSSSTRRYGGMGVGLAIVKIIMEKHGTQIQVDSKSGVGSTFWFQLPVILLS